MARYLIRRLNLFTATSLVLILVLFLATHLFPVSLDVALTGIEHPTTTEQQQTANQYQLGQSGFNQFTAYLRQRLSGNMGYSTTSHQAVSSELVRVLPASLELAIIAGVIAIGFGLPIGVLASLSKHKLTQNSIMVLTLTGYSIPVFWLGLTLSLWFGIKLEWLPFSGQISSLYHIQPVSGFMLIDTLLSDAPYRLEAFKSAVMHIILPAITLAIFPFTVVVRITKAAIDNVMNQTYIQAAEARGLSNHKVVLHHALPNALIPVIKNLGLMLGTFTSYAIMVEVIFSWPGIGNWLVQGIYHKNYTVIQGGIMTVSLLIIFLSILIDVIYTATNPISRKELYATN